MKLKTRFTIIISVFVVTILALTAFFFFLQYKKSIKDTIAQQQFRMLSIFADQIDSQLLTAQENLVQVAKEIPPVIMRHPEKAQEFFDKRTSLHSIFDNHLFLYTPAGKILVESPYAPGRRGLDFSSREYILNTIKAKKPCISDPYISSQPHKHPVIMFTVPLFDPEGKINGILAGGIDLMKDNFLGRIGTVKTGEIGNLYLYDTDGTMIMHPNKKRILVKQPRGQNIFYDAARDGFEGTGETTTSYGMKALSSFKRLKVKKWILAANSPQAEAYRPIRQAQQYFIIATVTGLIVIFIVISRIINYLIKPLELFTRHIEELPQKKGVDRLLSLKTTDEIGALSTVFNNMETDRTQAETKINRLNWLYTVLSKINEAIVRTHNLEDLYEKVCKITVEDGQFLMVWLGTIDKDTLLVKPVAKYGHNDNYLDLIRISVDPDDHEGVGPTGTALREKKYLINNDTENNPIMNSWRDEALKRGYLSSAAFPLLRDGKLFGAITFYASEPFYFTEEAIGLLLSLSNDVSFAIESIINEEERRNAEEALKKREESFRRVIDRNPVAMAVTDKKDKFMFFNNKFIETFGYTMEDMPTVDDWWPRAYPDAEYRKKVINGWTTAANKAIKDRKQRSPQEWRVTCEDGSVRDIEFGMSAMQDFNIIIFHDITESKQYKEQLETANELLKNIIEFLPDATFIIDMEKRVIAWNRAIEKMTGLPKEEIIGKHYYYAAVPFYGEPRPGLIELLDIDDKELALKYVYVTKKLDVLYAEALTPALNNGQGAYVWATAGPLFDGNGNMIGGIQSIRDISDRKRYEEARLASEEKYRTLFEESKDAVFISTPEGKFLDINQAGIELFGYSCKEDLLTIDIDKELYVNPDNRKIYRQVLFEKGFVKDHEIHIKTKDGSKRTVLVTASVVRDEHGAIRAYRGIMRDVTEHKNLERQLLQSQKMQAVGQLAGGLAHDFNNLLSAIIGFSDLALMELPDDHSVIERLKIISGAGEKAAALVRQLLAFSRKQVLEMNVVSLNTIIENIGKLLASSIGENVVLKLNTKNPVKNVLADAGQIEHVLINLSVNARDAMLSGGCLTIATADVHLDEDDIKTVEDLARPGNYVLLSVTDTGQGMGREIQEKIFEPFFSTKELGKGTGLGLSTVYGIVKQHNGHIWVDSEEGKGSTFNIYLPAVEDKAIKTGKTKVSVMAPGTETILVVDDNPNIRELISDTLQPLGYKVLKAPSTDEALEIAEQLKGKIDLLLTDIVMHGMNGLELTKLFLKRWPQTKAIVMSGYGEKVIINEGIKREDMIFIQKPLTPTKIATKLRDVLDGKQ